MDSHSVGPEHRAPARRTRIPPTGRARRRPHRRDCWRELAETEARLATVEQALARRDLELEEVRHRVANGLQLAAAFLSMQTKATPDPLARASLAETSDRIAAVGRVHRNLFGSGGDDRVDLGRLLADVGPDFAAAAGLACVIHADPIEVTRQTAVNLAMIVSELAINAGKHAYADQGGALRISCARQEDELWLQVCDDGVGLPPGFSFEGSGGTGMKIIGSIVEQLGAVLACENRDGACFTLKMPLAIGGPTTAAG